MFRSGEIVPVALAAMALVGFVNCASVSPVDRFEKTDTLKVDVRGHHIEIPRFRSSETKLSDKRYAFDQQLVATLKDEITGLTNEILVKNHNWLSQGKSLGSLGLKLKGIAKENSKLKQIDTSPVLNSGLGVTNGKMLDNMIKVGKDEKLDKVTDEEAQERFVVLMEAMEKLTAKSNTGLVLEYPKMTVDGRSLEAYLKPSIQALLKKSSLMSGTLKLAALLLKRTKDLPGPGRESSAKASRANGAGDDGDDGEDGNFPEDELDLA